MSVCNLNLNPGKGNAYITLAAREGGQCGEITASSWLFLEVLSYFWSSCSWFPNR